MAKVPGPVSLDRIPRHRERVILANTMLRLGVLLDQFISHKPSAHADVSFVALAVFCGHLNGKPMTAGKIALTLDMPRTTVVDRLTFLMQHNYVRKYGRYYYGAGRHMLRPSVDLNRAKGIILEAAERLNSIR